MCCVTYCARVYFRSSVRPPDDWLEKQSPVFGMKGHWIKTDGCYTIRHDAGSWEARWFCDNPQPELSHEYMSTHLVWGGTALEQAWERKNAPAVKTAGNPPRRPHCTQGVVTEADLEASRIPFKNISVRLLLSGEKPTQAWLREYRDVLPPGYLLEDDGVVSVVLMPNGGWEVVWVSDKQFTETAWRLAEKRYQCAFAKFEIMFTRTLGPKDWRWRWCVRCDHCFPDGQSGKSSSGPLVKHHVECLGGQAPSIYQGQEREPCRV